MVKKTKSIHSKNGKSTFVASVYNLKGEAVGKINMPKYIFDVKVHPQLLSLAVRVYLENQRLGTRMTKTRSQVTGSTRKIYRQKGTGRARHGDIKAPIFIGGGIAHGPKIKDYTLALPQKMKKLALFGALSQKYQMDRIKVVANLDNFPIKTKNMFELLQNLKLINKQKTATNLLITDKKRFDLYLAGRNISSLSISPINQLHPYQVLATNNLIFLKSAIESLTPKAETKKLSKNKQTKSSSRRKSKK